MAARTVHGTLERADGAERAEASFAGYRVELVFTAKVELAQLDGDGSSGPPVDREESGASANEPLAAAEGRGSIPSEMLADPQHVDTGAVDTSAGTGFVETTGTSVRTSVRAGSPAQPILTEATASASSDEHGRFTLAIADGVEISGPTVRFVVSAPSGTTVDETTVETAALSERVIIAIEPVPPVTLEPVDETTRPTTPTRRVGGRIVNLAGEPLPPGLQVVVMARRADAAAGTKAEPVAVARVDRSGVFFADVPNEEFAEATAVIPGAASTDIPVPLEDGRIVPSVLLPVKIDDSVEIALPDDCGCGGAVEPRMASHQDRALSPETFTDLGACGCVTFNKPNSVLEEFDFFSVVRTTEPQVRHLTLAETAPGSNGSSPGGRPTDAALTVMAFDVRLETRELDDKAAFQVTLETTDGSRILVRREVEAMGGLLELRTPSGLTIGEALRGSTDEDALKFVSPTSRSWSVVANTDGTDAIGLDLRSVRRVEVIGASSGKPWALSAIGISATTSDGDTIALRIGGDEFHELEPWQVFDGQPGAPLPTWGANAGIAVAATYAVRGSGTTTAERPPPFSPAARGELIAALESMGLPASGRSILNPDIEVDWDETPTFAQAASVAHGHLLHFKQEWYADGYSLGDLLYSLPLAPGQKKLISVVDWERRERTERAEASTAREGVSAFLSRDRDLGEVVSGALTESMRGGSRNTTSGIGVGTAGAGSGSYYGMNFGSLVGVSGGYGESDSSAWQVSGKTISAGSMQTLRDNTLQSASAVRSLRSSVVQTVSQGESTRVTTEVVANHNHCHALTIQYFEVLRHLRVVHRLADVSECLFVPLPIKPFDGRKTLRWRQSLEAYLRRLELASAFDATRRVEMNWSEVDYPVGRYGDEQVTSISGELELTILIPLPPLPPRPKPSPEQKPEEIAKALREATDPTAGFLGVLTAVATLGGSLIANQAIAATEKATKAAIEGSRALAEELLAETSPQAQYEKFQHEVMPGVAAGFVDQLELYALVKGAEVRIGSADFTLVSEYRPAVPLLASVRASFPPGIRRGDVTQIRIKSRNGLPTGCRVIVNSATLRYRTRLFEHGLVEDRRANDDVDLPVVSVSFDTMGIPTVTPVTAGQGAALSTPLDAWEQRNPRTEDRRLSATLLEHLNEHLEFYHHALWWTMDPNRRYMLLDGFEAPGAGGRSIASVVENRLIGIVGNSLVLPVANGVRLDPRLRAPAPQLSSNGNGRPAPSPLLSLYDIEPSPPAFVALPTRGVFAEAVMGKCNACEQIDESRFWRWEESPIDEPPAIEPASTATRRAEPPSLTPTPFPTPIVSIQNAPEIPTPAGVAAVLDALGKQVFNDITGLAGTQANAAMAYSKALDTALAFGKEASALAQQAAMVKSKDQVLGAIDKAQQGGKIKDEDAEKHRNNAFDRMTMTPPPLVEATGDPDEWAPYPGTSTPSKPKPGPTPSGRKLADPSPNIVPVSVMFRAFVPSELWEPFVGSPLVFNGDGRSFHPINRTSRAEAAVSFRLDVDDFAVTEEKVNTSFGMAQVYLLASSHAVAGKPVWWREKDAGAQFLTQRRLQPDQNQFEATVTRESNRVVVQFLLRAQPYFPWEELPKALDIPVLSQLDALLADFANPDFDASVTVTIANMGDGSPRYTVAGTHDRFPAYEVYINGEQAYASDQAKLQQVVDVAAALNQTWPVTAPALQLLKLQ